MVYCGEQTIEAASTPCSSVARAVVVLNMVNEETTAKARNGAAGAGWGEARGATALSLVEVTAERIGVDGGSNTTGSIVHGLPSMFWPLFGAYIPAADERASQPSRRPATQMHKM